MRWKGPILLLVLLLQRAAAQVPDWLSGPPDTRMHADRGRIYAEVFDDVAERCGIDLDAEPLARDRLIGAVNHAVTLWRQHRQAAYRAELRYLSFAGRDPVHCEFRLRGPRIGQLLGR